MEQKYCYVFWTCKELAEAKQIVYGLLEDRLIACASILPEILSMFHWEGEIEEAKEVKVILKTKKIKFEIIRTYIADRCSYQVPEILEVPIENGNPPYLQWIDQELKK
jgi:periplasmic divalent cation tolerance protein